MLSHNVSKQNAEVKHNKQVFQTVELESNTLLLKAGKECPALQEVLLPILHRGL